MSKKQLKRPVRRVIRVVEWREGSLCPQWPRCQCGAQGYLNLSEPSNCGRKPKTRRLVREEYA